MCIHCIGYDLLSLVIEAESGIYMAKGEWKNIVKQKVGTPDLKSQHIHVTILNYV